MDMDPSNLDLRLLHANKDIASRNYWRERLSGFDPNNYFDSFSKEATAPATGERAQVEICAPSGAYDELNRLAASGAAKHVVLLAVLAVLARHCSSAKDITLFCPLYLTADAQESFPGPVPVRINEFASFSVQQYLLQVRDHVIKDLSHGNLPVLSMMNLEEKDLRRSSLTGMLVEGVHSPLAFRALEIDLLFSFSVSGELSLNITYNSGKFAAAAVVEIGRLYFNMLRGIMSGKEKRLCDIDMLSDEEKRRILFGFNDSHLEHDRTETIVSLFEKQVVSTPDRTAIVYEGRRMTYSELNRQANRLAGYLKELGVVHNDVIAVMCERSELMVAALFGVLKAGAAYVPIDPVYPPDRIAYILRDSGANVLLVSDGLALAVDYEGHVVHLDRIINGHEENPGLRIAPRDLCYLIYTSGSTGKPKGVMIAHSNVVNFFAGLNREFPPREEDCMLAITSTSFDISVLELLWTLCNGIEVVVHPSDVSLNSLNRYLPNEDVNMDFSLFFFSSYNNKDRSKYELLVESVKYADDNGFHAVWSPERHFHEFGGLFPNPAVLSAALAMITRNVRLMSGSVVAPLHDEIRIAEEWSVVDNLSNGRVGISFASGWNPNDFVLSATPYANRQDRMFEQIKLVKELWRGGKIGRKNGLGQDVEMRVFPEPIQSELPVWITSGGSSETFRRAGAIGANLLTHLLGQDLEDLGKNIKLYREARKDNGHDPRSGKVTLMLHTYIGEDIGEVERLVEKPFTEYLIDSIGLSKVLLEESGIREEDIPEKEKQQLLKSAFQRYYKTASLIGTKSSCGRMVQSLKETGIDEIACLVDFGIEKSKVLEGLRRLSELKDFCSGKQVRGHKPITMMQSTVSFARLAHQSEGSRSFLRSLRHLLLGGEPLQESLVRELKASGGRTAIYNMYGPTETTVWSCMYRLEQEKVSVGKPMANTKIYLLNDSLRPVPVGMIGDLYIGGEGIAQGYWKRPELTLERFLPNPFAEGEKMYKTGDLARWRPDGNIELLGRSDFQVKMHGYRIEPGEIESRLLERAGVREAVVVAKEDKEEANKCMVAYVVCEEETDLAELREHLEKTLPYYMVPAYIMRLERIPLTPNGKIDRSALPDPKIEVARDYVGPSSETEETLAGLWAEVLRTDRSLLSINKSFFELGGNSLKLIRLNSLVNERMGLQTTITEMLRFSTISSFAGLIKQGEPSTDQYKEDAKEEVAEMQTAIDILNANW
jgi:natural product biosynthesis luciferase-like monooxygenase protein